MNNIGRCPLGEEHIFSYNITIYAKCKHQENVWMTASILPDHPRSDKIAVSIHISRDAAKAGHAAKKNITIVRI